MTKSHDDPHDDLAPVILERLAALPREADPPVGLEEKVMRAMRARGELRGRGQRRWYGIAVAGLAAAVVIFAAGLAVGIRTAGPAPVPADPTPQWMLLLYEDAGYEAAPAGAEAGRVREYGAWAGRLAARGAYVAGEKLGESGTLLARGGDALEVADVLPRSHEGVLTGYFVIRAGSRDEAIAIASDCPHLRYRGRISLRRIDPT